MEVMEHWHVDTGGAVPDLGSLGGLGGVGDLGAVGGVAELV